jgi:PKD repeat protein
MGRWLDVASKENSGACMSLRNKRRSVFGTAISGMLVCILCLHVSSRQLLSEAVPRTAIYPEWGPGTAVDPNTGKAVSVMVRIPPRSKAATVNDAQYVVDAGSKNVRIFVSIADAADEGFNDAKFGTARLSAFLFAMGIWADLLEGDQQIVIQASFDPLGTFVLGGARPNGFFSPAASSGLRNVLYPAPLYRYLSGFDSSRFFGADIVAQFNSDIDPQCDCSTTDCKDVRCTGSRWYYGNDGNTPSKDYDFVTVAVHELCHGLGFYDSFLSDGSVIFDLPLVFDMFLVNGAGQRLLELVPSQNNVNGNNVFWDGANGVQAWRTDFGQTGNVRMYAPTPFEPGSSIAHLDMDTVAGTEFAMMGPALDTGFSIHSPDSVVMGMMKDMGWNSNRTTGSGDGEPEPGGSVDDHPNAPPQATDMGTPNPTVIRFGTIFETQGDRDSFKFAAGIDNTYLVRLRPNTSLGNARVTLYAPNGTTIIDTADGAEQDNPEITFTADQTASYFIVVGSNGTAPFPSTFTYEISVTLTEEPPPSATPIVAVARAIPSKGTAPLLVQFSGAASPASQVISRDWDFGDGSGSIQAVDQHTYSLPGTYTATFTAFDILGTRTTATAVIQVEPPVNKLPTAKISASASSGDTPLTVRFTAVASDSDGSIVRYDWNFGDGGTATGSKVEYTFTQTGLFDVILTVTDNQGATATSRLRVRVGLPASTDEQQAAQETTTTVGCPLCSGCGQIGGLSFALVLVGLWGMGLMRRPG